jgi:hypothetical protein
MFPFISRRSGATARDNTSVKWNMPEQDGSSHNNSVFLANSSAGIICRRKGGDTVSNPYPFRCKVVSDLLRRFPDLLESQSIRINHLSPSPLINHVTHLTGSYPRPPPTHRSNINSQPPESSICARPRPPYSRSQTMVLPTSSSTTLETRSYFSIEVQPLCASSYGYPYICIPALHVNQEGTGLVCG